MTVTTFWKASPLLIRLSVVLHAACLAALLLRPSRGLEFVLLLVANHMGIFVAIMAGRSSLLGKNLSRLPAAARHRGEVALTFDDGPDPAVTPHLLDSLAQYQARASFFCVAARAAAHPELVREIIRQGHSVENHSWHHPRLFSILPWRRCRQEVQQAQNILTAITGVAPQFFRAPMGFRHPLLGGVLAEMGLSYISWTRRGFDTISREPQRVLKRLTRKLAAGDIILLHDGICTSPARSPQVTVEVLPLLLSHLQAAGLRAVSLPMAMVEQPDTASGTIGQYQACALARPITEQIQPASAQRMTSGDAP